MLTFILITIIIYVCALISIKRTEPQFKFLSAATAAVGVFGLIVCCMVSCVITLLICTIVNESVGKREITKRINMVSLSNGVEPAGRFIIGCGSIKGEEYYYYFVHNGEGYIRGKVPVDSSIIIESSDIVVGSTGVEEGKTPCIEVETTNIPESLEYWFFSVNPKPHYRIMVPVGTVVQRFSVE